MSVKINENGCWDWRKYSDRHGYGKHYVNGKLWSAHRLSYTLFKEEIPEGLVIRHQCHNRKCINPEHLLTGTVQDNANDSKSAHRTATGERQGAAKLTWEIVRHIRKFEMETPNKNLREKYGVSKTAIVCVRNNKTWKEVEGWNGIKR